MVGKAWFGGLNNNKTIIVVTHSDEVAGQSDIVPLRH